MSDPARHSDDTRRLQTGFRAVPAIGHWQASADDRLLPIPSRRARSWAKGLTLCTLALCAAVALWSAADERYRDPVWLVSNVTAKAGSMARSLNAPKDAAPTAAKPESQSASAQPPSVGEAFGPETRMEITSPAIVSAPSVEAPASPPAVDASNASPDGHAVAYAPPVVPADPLMARAQAAGLHPEISRAVLARLSATDFHNAAVAIKTALAEVADDGSLFWPRQRAADQALFQVYFVPGAPAGCRRYVVTITRDRWSATALPMERCGVLAVRLKG